MNSKREDSFHIDIKQNYHDSFDFNDFAKQIRYSKINKEEILKLKEETVLYERIKKKRNSSALLLQKNVRGYLSRKKFNSRMFVLK